MSDSWPHGLQHARLPCPSPSPRACSNSCPLCKWCHPAISAQIVQPSLHPLLSPSPPAFNLSQHQGVSNKSAIWIRWPKYWQFSFSINDYWLMTIEDYSGLISFRIDWFALLVVGPRGSQESSPTPQFKSVNSLVLGLLNGPILMSIYDYWKNHSFDYMDLCRQSNVSSF